MVARRRSSAVLLSAVIDAAVAVNAAAAEQQREQHQPQQQGLRAPIVPDEIAPVDQHNRRLHNPVEYNQQQRRTRGGHVHLEVQEDPQVVDPQDEQELQAELPEKLIVGGERVEDDGDAYPSFASLRGCDKDDDDCHNYGASSAAGDYDWGRCGATLISPRHVLTAGHCVDERVREKFDLKGVTVGASVRFGDDDDDDDDDDSSSVFVDATWNAVTLHPRYDEDGEGMPENDVALIELPEGVYLPDYANVDTGSVLPFLRDAEGLPEYTIVGHGKRSGSRFGRASKYLMEATVYGLDDDICRDAFDDNYDSKSMTCASDVGTSTCGGDSGGPAYSMNPVAANYAATAGVVDSDRPVLMGVTSWGRRGCEGGDDSPSVFAKVGAMVRWFGPEVCNSFERAEDRPDWCLVCNGAAGGCRDEGFEGDGDDWCCRVQPAAEEEPSKESDEEDPADARTESTPAADTESTSAAAAEASSTSTTTTATTTTESAISQREACRAERRLQRCPWGNSNMAWCSCGWLADMDGPDRREICESNQASSVCVLTCQEKCS